MDFLFLIVIYDTPESNIPISLLKIKKHPVSFKTIQTNQLSNMLVEIWRTKRLFKIDI